MSDSYTLEILPSNHVIEIEDGQDTRVVEVPSQVVEIVEFGRLVVEVTGAVSHTHTQYQSLSTWTIAHNLGHRPTVSVSSVGGVGVAMPEITYQSNDVCVLDFDVPFAGEAYLT